MAFLRSAFISVFCIYQAFVFGYSVVQLGRGMTPELSWLGLTLAAGAPLFFMGRSMLFPRPRTERHPVPFSIISGFGLAITMAMSYRYGPAAGIIHAWAGLAVILWAIYLAWYSNFNNRQVGPLATGTDLPVFGLRNASGHPVSSDEFIDQAAIWVFIRGNWCPFCTAQVAELANRYREITALPARIIAISPQSQEKLGQLAGRFDVPMVFLQDPENKAAEELGISDPWGLPLGLQVLGYDSDTVMPTVIATAPGGKIVYSHLTDNYRLRPEPADFIRVLETMDR